MTINQTNQDQRFFYEVDMQDVRQSANLKCYAVVTPRGFMGITYENAHRFHLTPDKSDEIRKAIIKDLKQRRVI
jgi:beta-galactosidase beta subunit